MALCPVCNIKFDNNDFLSLSEHFIDMADSSEPLHVMWVRSCSAVISKTDYMYIQRYELENMTTEYFGNNKKAHIAFH